MSKQRQIKTLIQKCGIFDWVKETKDKITQYQKQKIDDYDIWEMLEYQNIFYITEKMFIKNNLHYDTAITEENGLVKLLIVKSNENEIGFVQFDNHNKCVIVFVVEYKVIEIEGNFITKFERK